MHNLALYLTLKREGVPFELILIGHENLTYKIRPSVGSANNELNQELRHKLS